MKKLLRTLSLALFMGVTLLATSCDKKNNGNEPEPRVKGEGKIEYLDATAYDKWVYFSFAKGEEVKVDDPAKSMDWDVAFRRNNIRVNATVGYNGKAGVVKTASTDFTSQIDAKLLEFKANTMAIIELQSRMGLPEGQEPKMEKQPYLFEGTPNSYTLFEIHMDKMREGARAMYPIRKEIFVFRAADGKTIYKFKMLDSVNAKGQKGGTLSFQYAKI